MQNNHKGLGRSAGIFSNIESDEFTVEEKARAILTIMQKDNPKEVKKEAMMQVIRWLWNRCFRVHKDGGGHQIG